MVLRRDLAGKVDVPSGELILGDPYASDDDTVTVRVSPGSYPVYVNSFRGEYAEIRGRISATLAVRLRETGGGVGFDPLGAHALTPAAEDPDDPKDDGLHFVGIDKASVYVADRDAWQAYATSERSAADTLSEEIQLPGSGLRMVRASSGLGGGGYPVFGGYDLHGDLAVVYVSFDVVFEGERAREPWIGEDSDSEDESLPPA